MELARMSGGWRILNEMKSTQSVFRSVYVELFKENWGWGVKNVEIVLLPRIMLQYQLKEKGDWYRLSNEQITKVIGRVVPKRRVLELLGERYPEEGWDVGRFSHSLNKRATQKFVGVLLKEIFPDETIFEDYVFKENSKMCLFDFYLPERKLVIEYQGEQHYYSVLKWVPLEQQQIRDKEKKAICDNNHIQLVEIPYWWDWTLLSLSQIISSHLENAPSDSYPLNECYQLPH
eukprot:TRINITY_DN13419_c0_g3_i2.p1 TRINITY_DN13419_c0_g3~~TRINITY_DN13419_c0_g3_i2.p1  ORF type:complete len:249 (-),score=74.11 TRINITY_DN13419_c0_g3_i2:290-985(-)